MTAKNIKKRTFGLGIRFFILSEYDEGNFDLCEDDVFYRNDIVCFESFNCFVKDSMKMFYLMWM